MLIRYPAAYLLSDEEWWITGGSLSFGDENLLDQTELVNIATGEVTEYIDLPR